MEIVEINVQIVAQSNSARRDAIKMLARLLAELRRSNHKDRLDLRTGDVSEGHLQVEA
jgi:hypothetical protein